MNEETDKLFYVYQLRDPREDLPFYIGKGKGSRARDHFRLAIYDPNYIKKSIIKQIKLDKLEPLIEILKDNLSEIEAYNLEAEYISKYGRIFNNTGILSNIADGGKWGCRKLKSSDKCEKLLKFNESFWGNEFDSNNLSIEKRSKKSEAVRRRIENIPPWKSARSNEETVFVWSKADLINIVKNEFTETIIKILSLPENSSARIIRVKTKLHKGWDPLKDEQWLRDFVPNNVEDIVIPSATSDKVELYLKKLSNLPPWKSFRANSTTLKAWSLADQIFLNPEIGGKKLSTLLDLPKNCSGILNNIKYKWIDRGWNPLEDEQWLRDFREFPDSGPT